MEKNLIYGLRDPRNDVYFYIGKTTIGNNRPLSHLTNSHNKLVKNWVKSLESIKLAPYIDIIEENIDINDLANREKFWIKYYYDINPKLLNIQLIPNENKPITINKVRDDKNEIEFNSLIKLVLNISETLRKERVSRKLTQDEMSKLIGISRSTLSICENNGNVNIMVIKKYISTLKGVDILNANLNYKRVRK